MTEARKTGPGFALFAATASVGWSERMVAKSRAAGCDANLFGKRIREEQKAGFAALADLIEPGCSAPASVPRSQASADGATTVTPDAQAETCRRFGFSDVAAPDDPVTQADRQALLDWLCNCAAPQGGQVICTHDPEDKGWSPSCADLANGPCICKAYGCFRAALPASGDCAEACRAESPGATAALPAEGLRWTPTVSTPLSPVQTAPPPQSGLPVPPDAGARLSRGTDHALSARPVLFRMGNPRGGRDRGGHRTG